jgi:hypothetical protein
MFYTAGKMALTEVSNFVSQYGSQFVFTLGVE